MNTCEQIAFWADEAKFITPDEHRQLVAHLRSGLRGDALGRCRNLVGLRCNIQDDEEKLHAMTARWREVGGCCPGCLHGQAWSDVHKRLLRRLEHLDLLRYKVWRDAGVPGPGPRPTWSEQS